MVFKVNQSRPKQFELEKTLEIVCQHSSSIQLGALLNQGTRKAISSNDSAADSKPSPTSPRMSTGISDILTNVSLPTTSATLTVRIIKSFEYRTERSLVLHNVNLEETTVGELKETARRGTISLFVKSWNHKSSAAWLQLWRHSQDGNHIEMLPWVRGRDRPFSTTHRSIIICSDTMKLYTKAHGAKVCQMSPTC